jgi:hypothetical protein
MRFTFSQNPTIFEFEFPLFELVDGFLIKYKCGAFLGFT